MKKFLLSALSVLGIGTALHAQTFVSTTAENKNVVLEEFTGIYCGFCPAGHKIATDFKNANPNDVILINVHNGGFAQPNGSDPDFRTAFGNALDQQADVQGYPAGTVNRRNFPGFEQTDAQGNPVSGITAMGRGNWVSRGNVVLGESSPVNIAAEATIDLQTRELKVIVETYFTAAGGTAPYKLNVALLQNNVEGPQSGSGNPSAVLPNGNYNHQHMLRHLLTGQWGTDITSTAMGYFQADTLTYTIPAGIAYQSATAIAAELINMEVAVFVAEGQQTIITGNKATMTFVTPPGTSTASTQIAASSTTVDQYCAYNYTPSVDVTNNSTSGTAIDTFEVSYTVNGGTPVTQLVTTPLAANATTSVGFPQIQLGGGENSVVYEIDFSSYNSTLIDVSASADKSVTDGPYTKLNPTSTPAPVMEGMENGVLPSGANFTRDISTAIFETSGVALNRFGILDGPSANLGAIGGFATSNRSIYINFYNLQSSTPALYLTMQKVNLGTPAMLTFDHAYRQYQNENDRLEVEVSTDCGATWTTLWNQAGSTLSTLPASTTSFIPSAATDWRANTVDLSAYNNTNDVIVRFKATSGYGNNLLLDNINITNATNVTTVQKEAAEVRIMPNPVNNEMTLEFTMENTADANISIVNALGQQVQQVTNGLFSGTNTIAVNTSKLASGVYFVNILTKEGTTTKRFVRQ